MAGEGGGEDKAIRLGHPSYVWGFGQERRLELIRRYAPPAVAGQAVVDVGCGLGIYVRALGRLSPAVYGVDLDAEKVVAAGRELPNLCVAPAGRLPFAAKSFGLVLSHEVIEHVDDDRRALADAVRVLRPGGRLVIFCPNRLYPFETHGAFWGGRYHFGNIPLVGWLPDRWRRRLAPHVRAYTRGDLRRLLAGLPVRVVVHTQIYPGYDKIVRRHAMLGSLFRAVTYFLEHTPLRAFGLSHLVVVEKTTAA